MQARTAWGVLLVLLTLAAFAGSAASAPASSAYLPTAEDGIARVHVVWWNPVAQWFSTYPWQPAAGAGGTVTLWDLMPVFETYDLIAVADPTPANRAAVDAVARHAERYFDPTIKPVGGYTWRPGVADAFFDDSGWVGLDFMDAYTATHEQRYLLDAAKAFRFIAVSGWAKGGGVWWDTAHEKITAEPLAAEVLLGAEIYRATHKAWYLQTVEKFAAWADAHSWNAQRSLYQRNANDATVMNYIQGMMIGGYAILCSTLHQKSYCTKAEQVAQASLVAFPPSYHWAPECDALYLRGLLELWAADHNRRWYDVADQQAQLALANARDSQGLFTLGWDGSYASNDRILTDAGTLMLFAELAASPSPH